MESCLEEEMNIEKSADDVKKEAQVLIIGAGIVGSAIARELSRYRVDICVIDKEPGPGFGITKGSQGVIHSALGVFGSRIVKWFDKSISLKQFLKQPLHEKERLNFIGRRMLFDLEPVLDVKINRSGLIQVARNGADMEFWNIIKEVTAELGYKQLRIIDKEELQELEPLIDCSTRIGGIFDPEEYTTVPIEWAQAFTENARKNGARFLFNTRVVSITPGKGYYLIKTDKGPIKAEFVINVAGVFSDEVAAMSEKIDWTFNLFEHQYLVLENRNYLRHILFEMPGEDGQPKIMLPTPENRILAGVTMVPRSDRCDLSTTRGGLEHIGAIPNSFIPAISLKKDLIRSFKGYMHFNSRNPDDYLIEWTGSKFLNYIVCPPSIGGAPAIAQEVVKMLGDRGLELVQKSDFDPYRHKEPRFIDLSNEEKNRKIKTTSQYGHIICRCENVSEQEVREAIRKGATTLDEIKFETRAGMGRCQGSFCTSRILKIMSEELGVSPLEITLKGKGSNLLLCKTKDLLAGREEN